MTSRGNWDRETGRLLKRIDIPDLSDQLDVVRDYLQELASSYQQDREPPMAQSPRAHPRHGGRDLGNNEGQSRRLLPPTREWEIGLSNRRTTSPSVSQSYQISPPN